MSEIGSLLFRKKSTGILYRWFRHLLAGGVGTLLYTVLVALFVEVTGLHPVFSVILGFIILEFYTYVINRVWVYEATKGHRYAVPRFMTITVVALTLNTGIMYISVELLQWWYFWGLVATAGIVPPTNFILNYYWAFK